MSPLLQKVLEATFRRNIDTLTLSREKNWPPPNKTEEIKKADEECHRLWKVDWATGEPFVGPLERFQWRVRITCFAFFQFLDGKITSILLISCLAMDEIIHRIAERIDGDALTDFLAISSYTKLRLVFK
jgi:hypothetical protein